MRGVVSGGLILLYLVTGAILTLRALRHLREPNRVVWGFDIFRPQLFTREGQRLRQSAVRFYLLGGFALVLALYAIAHG